MEKLKETEDEGSNKSKKISEEEKEVEAEEDENSNDDNSDNNDIQFANNDGLMLANAVGSKEFEVYYKADVLDDFHDRLYSQQELEAEEKELYCTTFREKVKGVVKGVVDFLNAEFGVATPKMRAKFLKDVQHADYIAARIWLLKYGDDPDFINCQSHIDGRTALCTAASNNDPRIIRLLLRRHTLPDIGDVFGCVALHYAAEHGNRRIMNAILKLTADVDAGDNNGITPLIKATCSNQFEAAAMLIDNGASLDKRDRIARWSALHHAAYCGHLRIAKLLVNSGANHKLKSREKDTAELIALGRANKETALYLKSLDAPPILGGADAFLGSDMGDLVLPPLVKPKNKEVRVKPKPKIKR